MKYGTETLIELIKRKKYKAAEIVLHKALDKTPKDAYILTQLGVSCYASFELYSWQNPLVIREIRAVYRRMESYFKHD